MSAPSPVTPCPSCGAMLLEGQRFCPGCGAAAPPPPPAAPTSCASCGAALVPAARFCASCGSPVAQAAPPPPPAPAPAPAPAATWHPAAPPPQPSLPVLCGACGAALVPGDVFCAACGASTIGQPAPAAEPALAAAAANLCPGCGTPRRPGARFCRVCGAAGEPVPQPETLVNVAPPPAAPVPQPLAPRPAPPPAYAPQAPPPRAFSPQAAPPARQPFGAGRPPAMRPAPRPAAPRAPGGGFALTYATLAAGAGLVLAAISPMLNWAKVSAGGRSASSGPFDDGAVYRLGDWLGDTEGLDAWAVLLIAIAGLVVLGITVAGRLDARRGASFAASAGGLLVALAIMEMQYIWSRPAGGGVDLGPTFGLYILLAGGVLAALSRFLPAKQIGG